MRYSTRHGWSATGVALVALVLSLANFWAPTCFAEEPGTAEKKAADKKTDELAWLRVTRKTPDGPPLTMDTAIVRYVPADGKNNGLTVDLIGAVHIGDRKYYETLNKQFEKYDVLLYELVAPENHQVKKGQGSSNAHPVGVLQNGMKGLLELEHQLSVIDYTKKNFVHADMSPEQFAKSMSDRDESFLQMFFRMMGQSMAMQSRNSGASDFDLIRALFSKNRSLMLKRVMAEQFEGMESALVGFSGPDGSTIITERNKVALKVLADQIAKEKKTIGIFYGAGHMSDMDERLREEFNLKPAKTRWITAWDLHGKKEK